MNDRFDERGKRRENLQQICEEEHMERKNVRCEKKKKKGWKKKWKEKDRERKKDQRKMK